MKDGMLYVQEMRRVDPLVLIARGDVGRMSFAVINGGLTVRFFLSRKRGNSSGCKERTHHVGSASNLRDEIRDEPAEARSRVLPICYLFGIFAKA